jgi:hypothetical protein
MVFSIGSQGSCEALLRVLPLSRDGEITPEQQRWLYEEGAAWIFRLGKCHVKQRKCSPNYWIIMVYTFFIGIYHENGGFLQELCVCVFFWPKKRII